MTKRTLVTTTTCLLHCTQHIIWLRATHRRESCQEGLEAVQAAGGLLWPMCRKAMVLLGIATGPVGVRHIA